MSMKRTRERAKIKGGSVRAEDWNREMGEVLRPISDWKDARGLFGEVVLRIEQEQLLDRVKTEAAIQVTYWIDKAADGWHGPCFNKSCMDIAEEWAIIWQEATQALAGKKPEFIERMKLVFADKAIDILPPSEKSVFELLKLVT